MKKLIAIICSVLISAGLFAQKAENKSADEKKKKVEIIKIIDGDTVCHDVSVMCGDLDTKNHQMRIRRMERISSEELSEDIQKIIKDIDIYINVEDEHKKMIIKRMSIEEDDIEEMLKEFGEDEEIVLDMKGGRENVKVIKIKMSKDGGEELKVINMERGKCREDKMEKERKFQGPPHGRGQGTASPRGIRVYPNPANNEINLNFEVPEDGEVDVRILNTDGKEVFAKTYKEAGIQKETVKIDGNEKGIYIVSLKDKNRNITKKIIVE